eukprot:CAMPEP_0202966694 /NCGR_PEP_ID=MMETSP1396-20130829/11245_1 /ASSEMBLY_ACC=CAM_ASM_000872 /TAXON_ID= /ORGANISM="Pseudokeronopsis sp., Strain Brazil" /LENGTH=38 /DNA_ID= /DNA_START= /DNA_END= /DNA_ORIENTATION=
MNTFHGGGLELKTGGSVQKQMKQVQHRRRLQRKQRQQQ